MLLLEVLNLVKVAALKHNLHGCSATVQLFSGFINIVFVNLPNCFVFCDDDDELWQQVLEKPQKSANLISSFVARISIFQQWMKQLFCI